MIIQKEKNPIALLVLASILLLSSMIYYLVTKDLALCLFFLIIGLILLVISLFLLFKRLRHKKILLEKYKKKEFLDARIAEVSKVYTSMAKILKDEVYEVYIELKLADKAYILKSDWLEKDIITEKQIERNKMIKVCFLDEKNYIFFF